jgi:hypothetical protein
MSDPSIVEKAVDAAGSRMNVYWRMLGFVLVTTCLIVALVYPLPFYGRQWSAVFDLAHSLTFFTVFVLIVGLLDPARIGLSSMSVAIFSLTASRLNLLFVTLFAGGVLCEIAQTLVQRQPTFNDVLANGAGLLAGLLFCRSSITTAAMTRIVLITLAIGCIIAPCVGPIRELIECRRQQQDFPLLASFERPRELTAWKAHDATMSCSQEWAADGVASMKITASNNTYPGAEMVWPINDWDSQSYLTIDLHNPESSSAEIGISVFDSLHAQSNFDPSDRFGTSVVVAPRSSTTVTLTLAEVQSAPRTREMDMAQIASLNIFLIDPRPGHSFYVDNVRLAD